MGGCTGCPPRLPHRADLRGSASSAGTPEACRRAAVTHPDIAVLLQGGKGDAVRLGYAQPTGDLLMILDAGLSVDPEDLPQLLDAMVTGAGIRHGFARRPQHGSAMHALPAGTALLRGMSRDARAASPVWRTRPELRLVYREWFDRLLDATGARRPVVEIARGR